MNYTKTTTPGLYGNDHETYFVNKHGVMFCVQAPHLAHDAKPMQILNNRMPIDCVGISALDIDDGIDIPKWVFDAK